MEKIDSSEETNILENKALSKTLFYLVIEPDNVEGLVKRNLFNAKSHIYEQLKKLTENKLIEKSKKNRYFVKYDQVYEKFIEFYISKNNCQLIPTSMDGFEVSKSESMLFPKELFKLMQISADKCISECFELKDKTQEAFKKVKETLSCIETFQVKEDSEIIEKYNTKEIFYEFFLKKQFKTNAFIHNLIETHIKTLVNNKINYEKEIDLSINGFFIDLEKVIRKISPSFIISRINNLSQLYNITKDIISEDELMKIKDALKIIILLKSFNNIAYNRSIQLDLSFERKILKDKNIELDF